MKLHMEEPSEKVLRLLKRSKDEKVVAKTIFDARRESGKGWIWLTTVVQDYPRLVSYVFERDFTSNISSITVDKKLFEADIKNAFLGELAAERLILPYKPLDGSSYMKEKELYFKKKIISESVRNLILEFSELSKELRIKPEYFPLDYIDRRSKIYKPSKILYENISKPESKSLFLSAISRGFDPAIEQLVADGILFVGNETIRISDAFIEKNLEKERLNPAFIDVLGKSARAVLVDGFARVNSPLQNLKEFYSKFETAPLREEIRVPDPRKYLSFNVQLKITDIAVEKTVQLLLNSFKPWWKPSSPIKIKKIGEILNTVFLVEVDSADTPKKMIVKSFDNWVGLKWFPLSLWTIGLRKFSKIGRKRLANEYFMNIDLKKHNFWVPEIYCLDWDRGLLLEEYVEGINIDSVVRRITRTCRATSKEEEIMERVGSLLGNLHRQGFMLGDCKPENMILSRDDHLFIVDLEQASKVTDPAWDIAVFLYFAGRYAIKKQGIKIITKDFIKGYINFAPYDNVLKATRIPYPNFFTPITSLYIITEIAKSSREEFTYRN